MIMRLVTTLAACLLATPLVAAPADIALLARLAGNWQGSGALHDGGAPAPIACRLTGTPAGDRLRITGQCSGAAKGAKLDAELRWSDGPGLYVGRFQGASLSGTRQISGKRRGDALMLRISGDGSAQALAMDFSGDDNLRLTISGPGGSRLLDLPLTKQ